MGSGDSALDREPPESEQSSRSGPIILDRGPQGSFALSTCWVGRATRSPETGGMAWPSETTSNSEPSRASASLHRLTPLKPTGVGPGSFLRTGTSAFTNGGLLWGKGAACLPDTGWGQGTVGRSSLRSGGCRLAGPQGLSTSLLLPPRPSEQHLWVSVLPEPRPKLAQGWGRGGDSRSECEVSVCDLRCCMWTLNCTCSF